MSMSGGSTGDAYGSAAVNMTDFIWQDRDIRFDTVPAQLANRRGEYIIDSINSVEDTKGNNGERGSLIVTNLRILWVCHKSNRTNLSIGYSCVLTINVRKAKSRLRGHVHALFIVAKHGGSRFEFIFTSLVKSSPRLFTTVQAVLKAYESSKLYRDLKLRGSIIRDNQLQLLPHEQQYSRITGVWNLSSDQGNLGTFFVTNLRMAWHANLAQNFNVSIPYMQVKSLRVRDSKFGPALVVETSPRSGGYILGFRIDPNDRLMSVHKELASLHQIFSVNPIFGVDFVVEDKAQSLEAVTAERVEDDVEIINNDDHKDAAALYFADRDKAADRQVVFSNELGLAVESLPPGTTLEALWKVV